MLRTSRPAPLVIVIVLVLVCAAAGAPRKGVVFADESAPAAAPPAAAPPADARTVSFNRDIRPLLSDRCFYCHGPDPEHREADLRFDIESAAKSDLGGYSAIVPGSLEDSELIERIATTDASDRMPPEDSGKELSPPEIELFKQWILQGAPYEAHWIYEKVSRPLVPHTHDASWPANPIDRFILSRLEKKKLSPSAEADAVTLARRLWLDVTGLPPTPAELASMDPDADGDISDESWSTAIEHALASPHYGERMAVYWLDLVRYADTVGYHGDQDHNVSPYRDWVIWAFNQNLPFDQFTTAQLAGDLLPESDENQKIASAYNRLLQTTHEGGAQDGEYLAKYAADRVRNLSVVWLGGTVGCAECHNHKFDPYTQHDFYSLAAFFADLEQKGMYTGSPNATPTTRPPELDVLSPYDRERLAQLDAEIETLSTQTGADPEHAKTLASRRAERDAIAKATRKVLISRSVEPPRTTRVLERGNWMDTSGEIVQPAVPHFLPQIQTRSRTEDQRLTRLDLAHWLTSEEQPQVARVFVNRLWYVFFGAGLSRILDDTGSQGDWPSHPALLDWLAAEFMASGWDVQHMVRLILRSRTYRQSSLPHADLTAVDPENRLLARQNRYRIAAEFVRDAALQVSGLLDRSLGGRSVRPYQPAGYYAHLNFPQRKYVADKGNALYRRGVYTHWQRQYLHPMLKAFDAPSREECTAQRPQSNTPLAALTLLNDPAFIEMAREFAARILREGGNGNGNENENEDTDRTRITWAWKTALTREPLPRELAVLARVLTSERARFRDDTSAAEALVTIGDKSPAADLDRTELAAWTSVARTLFNLSEMYSRN